MSRRNNDGDELAMPRLAPLITTAGILLVAAIGYWLVFLTPGGADQSQGGPPGIVVEATEAITATSVRKLKAVGTLASNQSVVVRPEISGRLTKILFDDGVEVEAGTLLAELDKSVLQAEFNSAQATLALAKKEYGRADALLKRGTGTKQKRDQAVSDLQAAEASVALARAQLDKCEIRAPFDGTLGIRRNDVGAYLAAGDDIVNLEQTQPDQDRLRGAGTFPRRTGRRQGSATAQRRLSGRDLRRLDRRHQSALINQRTRAIQIQAFADNKDGRLRPGQFVSVTIRVNQRDGATFVPEQSLVPNSEAPAVFRIEDGVARMVPVEVGIRIARHVEILSGVAAGEMIVTAGQQRLADGVPVVPREPTFVPPSPPDEEIQMIDGQ